MGDIQTRETETGAETPTTTPRSDTIVDPLASEAMDSVMDGRRMALHAQLDGEIQVALSRLQVWQTVSQGELKKATDDAFGTAHYGAMMQAQTQSSARITAAYGTLMPRAKVARTFEEKLSILQEAVEAMQASGNILMGAVAADVVSGGEDTFAIQAQQLLGDAQATGTRHAQLHGQMILLQNEEMTRSAKSRAGDGLRAAFSE